MKFKTILPFILLLYATSFFSQEKKEREVRIEQKKFPHTALSSLQPYLKNAKRIRFYKETDGGKTSFETKFKKDRLLFSIEFDSIGILEDVEYIIKKVDVPDESWNKIENYIGETYNRPRIKKIQQQYPSKKNNQEQTLKDSFQNLLVPYINYELIVTSKGKEGFKEYEVLFDSKGAFLKSRKSIPQKYDHVLY